MRRMSWFAVLILMVAACGESASLSDSITDTVWEASDGRLIDFRTDGTYSAGSTVPDDVADADTEWGTWSLDGDVLTMTPSESEFCTTPGSYTVAIGESGELDVTLVEDECEGRANAWLDGLMPQPDTTP